MLGNNLKDISNTEFIGSILILHNNGYKSINGMELFEYWFDNNAFIGVDILTAENKYVFNALRILPLILSL